MLYLLPSQPSQRFPRSTKAISHRGAPHDRPSRPRRPRRPVSCVRRLIRAKFLRRRSAAFGSVISSAGRWRKSLAEIDTRRAGMQGGHSSRCPRCCCKTCWSRPSSRNGLIVLALAAAAVDCDGMASTDASDGIANMECCSLGSLGRTRSAS